MPPKTEPPKPRVHVDAPQDKLERLRQLQKLAADRERELVVVDRRDLLERCPHPLALAMYFDDKVVSTPAMEFVSRRWVKILKTDNGRNTTSIGPQQGKSQLSRWLVFWALLDDPNRRVVFASYSMGLARTSGRIIRSLVETYGAPYGLELDQSHHDAADWQLKGFAGGCLSASTESSLTGRPSDLMVLDDLLSGEAEANSPTIRDKVEVWWESTARVRMAPGAPAISIGTRWSEFDILQRFQDEGWDRINIPAKADGETFDSVADIPEARTPAGYLISTRGTTEDDWERIFEETGPRATAALFQGRPAPVEGGIFKRDWFENNRVQIAPPLHTIVIGVDPAETGTGDEAGILVAGIAEDQQLYIIADLSGMLSQGQWARRICLGAMRYDVNRVVAERTLGLNAAIGDAWQVVKRQAQALNDAHDAEQPISAAAALLRAAGDIDASDPVQLRELDDIRDKVDAMPSTGPRVVVITPKASKRTRAEAVTSLFEFGRCHLVGRFPKLEHQCVVWTEGQPSPNRIDVMAHVLAHLEKSRARATVARRPRHLQAVPTTTVHTLAR